MNGKKDKYIEVDGVVYDIASGRVVVDKKRKRSTSNKNSVLDLRTPHNIVASSQNAIRKREVQQAPRRHTNYPASRHPSVSNTTTNHVANIQSRPITKPKPKQPENATNKSIATNDQEVPDYLLFVLWKGLFPNGNLRLLQLSLIRTVFSPQTWLLLTLPLLLLQLRVIRHYTLNETIQKAKTFVSPERYDQVVIALAITLIAFLVGVIIRSCITAAGISVRLREIDNRPVKVLNALRSAMHAVARQALNYVIHITILVALTLGLLFFSQYIYTSTNPLIVSSKFQILVAIFLVWVVILVFLYAKHWLQVGLLSRSSKTAHIQLKSISLLFTTPSANIVSGITGIFLIALCYGAIFSMSWFVTNYFVDQAAAPAILILVIIAVITISLLTSLQYIQQSIWARQYYYSALNSKDKGELLYMEPTRPESIWPILVVISIAAIFMLGYFVIASQYASRLKGFLANIHASIPDEINIVVPIKK